MLQTSWLRVRLSVRRTRRRGWRSCGLAFVRGSRLARSFPRSASDALPSLGPPALAGGLDGLGAAGLWSRQQRP
eukprot:2346687-Lingulodinium_polyedra.AAC.1